MGESDNEEDGKGDTIQRIDINNFSDDNIIDML
jgi:hypothetical protein